MEEKQGTKHRLKKIVLKYDQRQGTELGMEISGVISPPLTDAPYSIRISAVSSIGKALLRNQSLESLAFSDPTSLPDSMFPGDLNLQSFAPSPQLSIFSEPCSSFTQYFKAFFPYQLFPQPFKREKLLLLFEGVETNVREVFPEERARQLTKWKDSPTDANLIIEIPNPVPELAAATLQVHYLETDPEQVDPHSWDFSINRDHHDYGYPDLYWSLRLDDQQIYHSAYVKNSLKTDFDLPSPVFYARKEGQYASLCVWDWDNTSFMQNRDDLISCFDLELQELQAQGKPYVGLQFPRIKEMDVSLNWLSH